MAEKTIDEVKDSALTNDSGAGATKGKAGLPNSNSNSEAMPTIDAKNGPSSKAEVIKYTAQHLQGLDPETAVAFYNKLVADFKSKDATYGGGKGTWAGASNAGSLAKEDLDIVLGSDESLSEEFKAKVATIFEAVVSAAVTVEIARLEEETEAKLSEAVAEITAELTEKVEGHLNHVTAKWIEENKLAVESSLRVEAAESFMGALKSAFAEHYVSIPSESVDVVESLTDQVETLEARVNEEVEIAVALRKELNTLKSASVLESALEGLTDTQKDKVRKLAETVEIGDDFAAKVSTLVEAVAPKAASQAVLSEDTMNEPVGISEEKTVTLDPVMASYVTSISRTKVR